MSMHISQFLKKQGAWLFGTRTDQHVPGYLMKKFKPLFGPARFRWEETAWSALGLTEEDIPSVIANGDLVTGSFHSEFTTDVGVGLEQFDLDLDAAVRHVRRARIDAGTVSALTLDDARWSPRALRDRLRQLEGSESRGLRGLYLIQTTYIADSFEVSLEVETEAAAEVSAQLAQLDITPSVDVETSGLTELQFTHSNKVPFAFTGSRI